MRRLDRRSKLFLVSLVLGLATLIVFQQQVVDGFRFMSGVNDLEVDSQRFQPEEAGNETRKSGKPFWVQESYRQEIDNLSEREYYVTQQNGTEKPFQNEYYDNSRPGIYVDVVSGEPLFSSKHKFDSGTGWPSFYRPLEPENVIERRDPGPFGVRTEVASRHARSHLGHLFSHPDTPTGLRYCINSAALEFIPAEDLEEEGYVRYSSMFR